MIVDATGPATHFFTVDLEEYFQANALEKVAPRTAWATLPSRVERNVDILLPLLERHRVVATFFVLGWVAKRQARLVQRIAAAGHEIASHGWWHRRVTELTVSEFREDVRSSKEVLEDITGTAVKGFRAPSFSIVPGREWAFDVLVEEGYSYDSSLFPVRRPDYGYPDAPPIAHMIDRPSGHLMEFPLATTLWQGVRIPAAGGAYLRHFPYHIVRRAFREHTDCKVPAVFYIHPWELDINQPRLDVPLLTRVRHYGGLRHTAGRLERLLAEFRFTSIARGLPRTETAAVEAPGRAVPAALAGPASISKEEVRDAETAGPALSS